MRRLSGVLLAGAILLLPAFSQTALAQAAPQKTTYTGEVVIAAYAVNAGKEADYEKVIATLKDALAKSSKPEAKQQLAGWKVIKNSADQPDGSSLYLHIITPGRQGRGLLDHEHRLRGRHRPEGTDRLLQPL